jgi:hypothetical protein
MSKAKRGGLTLKTGKIGRVNCFRQQICMPGERLNIDINGKVRLESLRERDVMRINAHLAVFWTPMRWLVSDWPDYIKQGSDTSVTLSTTADGNLARLGIGSYQGVQTTNRFDFWEDALLRIYNEWYKWPEDADATSWDDDGNKAVPLAKFWNRMRYDATPDASADYTVSSATSFDVRDLAEVQAKFRAAMKRDVLSYNRWMELINEVYKGDGSREVDQVPMMLDQVEIGVNPREIPATDGASLGQWQSLYDFNVNHSIKGFTAPEHGIISYLLLIRFPPVIESMHPLASDRADYEVLAADPEFLTSQAPQAVQRRDYEINTDTTEIGYLPAGWQWRCDHDVLGQRIDSKDTFPYMNTPNTQASAKDATRVKDAFRSTTLGDYLVDIFVDEDSRQPIGDAMDSYFSGMLDDVVTGAGGKNDEFPKGGKML